MRWRHDRENTSELMHRSAYTIRELTHLSKPPGQRTLNGIHLLPGYYKGGTQMANATVSAVQSQPIADRGALRAGLEATRTAFHGILDSVSGDRWLQKSPGSAWSVREVFVHVTWALEYLPKEIAMARQGKGMFNISKRVADPVSYWLIRWTARRSTPDSIQRRYDAAIDATIRALEMVPDSDWLLGADFYGEGHYTVLDLFQVPAHHLAEHTAGI